MMDYICPACGATYAPGEKFCQNCGTRLPEAVPAAPVTETPEVPAAPVYEAPAAPVAEAPAAPVYEAPAAPVAEAPAAPVYEAPAAPVYEAPAAPVAEAPAAPVAEAPAAPVYEAPAAPAYTAPAAPVPPAAPVYQAAPTYPPRQNVPNYAPTGAPNYAPKAAPVPPAAPNYAAPAYGAPAYAAAPAAPKKKKTGLIIGLCAGAAVLIAAALLLYFFVLSPSPSSITLSETSLSIACYDSVQLTATIEPEKASGSKVTWTSSDEDIATVYDGMVTAWDAGTCTITATTSNGKSATCEVTVEIEPYMITLSEYSLSLEAGDTETLDVTVYPENATKYTVVWSSSDTSVATVSDGKITAVGEGSCEITASIPDVDSSTCWVSVSGSGVTEGPAPTEEPTPVSSDYDKYIIGEWKLVLYYDYDSGEDIPVENIGLSGNIVFNADHTARVTMNGDYSDYTWAFEEVDSYGDYCFWLDNTGESLPFDYIAEDGEIWLYLDDTTLTYRK